MAHWYVKDLSKLTGISVQTLHHYDRIDLLKPSARLSNGYRIYSENDLVQLQQIIALKFFGFELSQIKVLLTGEMEILEHFSIQANLLEQKANTLLEASKALKSIISIVSDNNSIPWETIIKLIEVYRMTQKLEDSWVKEIFTTEELKQYATFKTELETNSESAQKSAFDQNWANLIVEIKNNLDKDPQSAIGMSLGKKCMMLINGLYGKKYAHLRTKKFAQGFVEGKGLEETGLTPEVIQWLDKAMDAYWRDRIYAIFDQVGKISANTVLNLWNEVLDDMYGEDVTRKKSLYNMALKDEKISKDAKRWLQSLQD